MMAPKVNCWEFKKCERQAGGSREWEWGICPAYTEKALDKIHGGKNAGRACWVVAGTFCGGPALGAEAQMRESCWECDFFQKVKEEEKSSPDGFCITRLEMQKFMSKAR